MNKKLKATEIVNFIVRIIIILAEAITTVIIYDILIEAVIIDKSAGAVIAGVFVGVIFYIADIVANVLCYISNLGTLILTKRQTMQLKDDEEAMKAIKKIRLENRITFIINLVFTILIIGWIVILQLQN